MEKIQQKTSLFLLLILAVGVLVLAGCNGGSPPSSVKLTVSGSVKLIDTGAGQQNVTVTLTSTKTAANVYSGVSSATGDVTLADVLAPDTYSVTITSADFEAGTLSNVTLTIPSDGTKAATLPTIYVTPKHPTGPAI
jgi:hypothetical protein